MTTALSPTIRLESPLEQADWNTRLAQFPGSGIFHSREWAAVLNHTYGFSPVYFSARDQNNWLALLPVMEVASCLTGKRGIALPFTDHCQALEISRGAQEPLFQAAVDHGKSRGWKYLETRGDSKPIASVNNTQPSLSFYSHELNLVPGLDELEKNFDDSVRRAIRRAEKSELTIETSSSEQAIRNFYKLHCQTRRHHGLPPQPFAFFKNIQLQILSRNLGTIIAVRWQNRVIAASVFFLWGKEAIYKFGASDRAFLPLRANNLAMRAGIQWCLRQGAQVLQMGRTSLANEGLRRFKLGWGTTESRLNYYKYDLRREKFVTDQDETTGWHTRIFQTLPIFLNRLAGAALYRHVA